MAHTHMHAHTHTCMHTHTHTCMHTNTQTASMNFSTPSVCVPPIQPGAQDILVVVDPLDVGFD